MKEKTREILNEMIEDMKDKLRIANADAMKADQIPLNRFDDVEELHAMVMRKDKFSVSEMDAIVSEIGNFRK